MPPIGLEQTLISLSHSTHIVSGNLLAPRNAEFENGTWLKGIIWDGSRPRKDFAKLNLNLNDTQMLLELDQSQTESESCWIALPKPRLKALPLISCTATTARR